MSEDETGIWKSTSLFLLIIRTCVSVSDIFNAKIWVLIILLHGSSCLLVIWKKAWGQVWKAFYW